MFHFNVKEHIVNKGEAWIATLSKEAVSRIWEIGRDARGDLRTFAARDVAALLQGEFPDEQVMQRVLLESMSSFSTFDTFAADSRLGRPEQPINPILLEEARGLYDAGLGCRSGICFEKNSWVPDTELPARAAEWISDLPSKYLDQVAEMVDMPISPTDLVDILGHHYERPDLLHDLVRQSVENVVPYDVFVDTLQAWGTLNDFDLVTYFRACRCFNGLVAAGFGLDLQAEQAKRKDAVSARVAPEQLIEVLGRHYSRPGGIIEAALEKSLEAGDSVGRFLAQLREEGKLGHLNDATMDGIRSCYGVLAGDYQRFVQNRQVVGAWTQHFSQRPEQTGPSRLGS